MTIRYVAILALLFIAVVAGCGGPPGESSVPAIQCGSLRVWPVPRGRPAVPREGHEALRRQARVKLTRATLDHVSYTAERFCVEQGRYPASFSELIEADSAIPLYTPCRFELLTAPLDAWNRPIVYELERGTPKIYSVGPDGVAGTPDDIRVIVGEDPESETEPIDAYEDCGLRDGV
jgi:hypothetical protein